MLATAQSKLKLLLKIHPKKNLLLKKKVNKIFPTQIGHLSPKLRNLN